MDFEKFERDLRTYYKSTEVPDASEKVRVLLDHIASEWQIDPQSLTLHELKLLCSAVIDTETQIVHDDVEELLAQKERLERQLERKRDTLQHAKYSIFNAIESAISPEALQTRSKLHQIKLQSIDLFDVLSETVESAIITTLEKGHDIEETVGEITKEITYETLNEGMLSTIRIRKILSTVLQSAIDIAEASPNHAEEILRGALRGVRSGLIRSINRFKQQLLYMPDEAKLLLIDDFEHLQAELSQIESLFSHIVTALANQSSSSTSKLLETLSDEIRFDMEELVHISKETVEVMRDHLNNLAKEAMQRSSKLLHSKTAKEAKRMGVQVWSIAKSAMDDALKSAKDAIDKK